MTAPGIPEPSRPTALLRGWRGRCPACGRGRLLHRYLKVVARCTDCGTPYGHYRADDAPPWLTIIVTGHIVVPSMLIVEQRFHPDMGLQLAFWPGLVLALSLLLLPRCKGFVLAMLWAMKAEGSERS